jgi:choline/glycine/proline betaine transport protein
MIYLAFSKFGHLRIGGQCQNLEFKTISWFAMLFSAGMGIGLLFWSNFRNIFKSPMAEGGTAEGSQGGYEIHLLHWGFLLGCLCIGRLSLAYFTSFSWTYHQIDFIPFGR